MDTVRNGDVENGAVVDWVASTKGVGDGWGETWWRRVSGLGLGRDCEDFDQLLYVVRQDDRVCSVQNLGED